MEDAKIAEKPGLGSRVDTMSNDHLPSSASSSITETDDSNDKGEIVLQDQSARLPFRRLLVIYFGIGIALIVSLMDQTAVSTAAPVIGTALNGSATISWVGSSFLVGNCAFQLVYGRMSDIFGRKNMLQIAVGLLAIGNLLCSFAQTPVQLYAFRAISGIGGGGVNNIAMVIVSDLIPLKDRGKYQGFISAATSLGNAIGPFVGGGLASVGQWRWLFRVLTILGAIVMILDHFILPLKPVTGDIKEKVLRIDYIGIFLSAAATVLLLVPISGGGSTFAWESAMVIALLVVGGACAIAFVVHEVKFTRLPILPMRIFAIQTSAVVMIQTFAIGTIYYGNIFYIPIFFQYVKSYNSLVAGSFVLVYTIPQAGWGIISGYYVSRTSHYKRIVVSGAALWTITLGLQLLWHPTTNIGEVLGILEIQCIGIGFSLQTTLVAALAATADKDRAVVTAGRNFFRTLGGAFGLAVANAIYQSRVIHKLATITALSASQQTDLLNSSLGLGDLPPALVGQIRDAYSHGLRYVFAFFTALGGVYFISSFAIKEIPFRKDSAALEAEKKAFKGVAGGAEENAEQGSASLAEEKVDMIESGRPEASRIDGEPDPNDLAISPPSIGPDALALESTPSRGQPDERRGAPNLGS